MDHTYLELSYFQVGAAALLILVNGAISLYYHARIIATMYPFAKADDSKAKGALPLAMSDKALCVLLVAPVMIFGIWWGPVWEWASAAVKTLVGGAA